MPGTPAGLKACLDGLTSDLPGGDSDEDVDGSDIEEAGGMEVTGESPDDAGEEEEAQPGKTTRGKPKRKAKAKAKAAAAGKRKGKAPVAPPAVDANWKKCNDCKKFKLEVCFHADMGKCKDCFNHRRSFGRCVSAQKADKEVAQLEKTDPKQAEKVFEMMWEGEFLAFAKSAQGGFLTDAEARSMWERMLHDDDLGKDNDGPRGFRRVAVKVRDILTQYEEISRSQVARREEKLGKKATEEDLAKRLRMVFSGMQHSGEGLGEFEDLLGQTVRNMSGEGGSSMLDGVLTNPAIADLMLRVKGKKASDDDMEGAEEQEDVEEGAEKTAKAASSKGTSTLQKARPPSDSRSSPSNSWFSEMQINKAERSFSLKIGRVRTQLSGTVVKMEEAIKEFAKDHMNYPQEVSSVTRRRAWLAAILEDSPTRLEGLLKEHKSKSVGAGKSEGASSRDMGAVARAGPCANFESLQHFGVLTAHCQLA